MVRIAGACKTGNTKLVGPAVPAALVAVTAMVVVTAVFGIPESNPALLIDAQDGSPVALQVGVLPVLVN